MEAVSAQAGLSFRLPGRAAPRPTSRGPSGRGLLGSRDLHHDSLWKLFDIRRQLQTIRTSLTPQVEAVRARAGLLCRSSGRAAPNPPPGAAFSVLEILTTIAFGGSWIRSRQLQTIQISRDSHVSRGGREGTRRALVPCRTSSDPSGRGLLGSKKNSSRSPLAAA